MLVYDGEKLVGGSPSSRRAWIEMASCRLTSAITASPSSRRAWIEITVLLSMGSGDLRRPPRGGRG